MHFLRIYKRTFFALLIIIFMAFTPFFTFAQQGKSNFENFQFNAPRVSQAYAQYNDVLRKEFTEKGLAYPPKEMLIRAFKAHNELEIWVKNNDDDTFTLFKDYSICALSGTLGPKRWEGDLQVPEGFYFISDFNPRSDFHLSLLLNYPNYSDLLLGNKQTPGGAIYIHGGCMTVGCLPMTDQGIKEIYTLSLVAKLNGQNNIPVHVFPIRFNKVGINFLGREYGRDQDRQKFWINLKAGHDYFERHKKIPPVMYNQEGKYIF